MENVTISVEEYKNLIKMQARVEIFAEHVNASEYSISRKECATLLGFEVEEKKND